MHEDTRARRKVKAIHISADLTVVVAIQINRFVFNINSLIVGLCYNQRPTISVCQGRLIISLSRRYQKQFFCVLIIVMLFLSIFSV